MTAPILSADSTGTAVVPKYNLAYVWTISLVAAMGGLLFGYDWVVIGGAKPFFEPFFNLTTEAQSGWANSCALVGCLVGSIISGGLSDKFGRKKLLIISAFLFAVSSVLTGWASDFLWFVIWRMLGGVAIGMASNLSPMYIAEVAPAHLRGRLVSINQLTIVLGVLGAQIANWVIGGGAPAPTDEAVNQLMQSMNLAKEDAVKIATADLIRPSWYGLYAWRWMFTAVTVPSLVFFFSSLFVPESPRWLVKNGRADRAQRILAKIGGEEYGAAEVADIQGTLASEEIHHVRFADLLDSKVFKILMVGVALAVLQQWSGINVIFNYAEEIYRNAGYGVSGVLFNIVITGAISLVFTFIAIGTVDRFGRRILMLTGCAAIGVSHVLIGVGYVLGLKGLAMLILTLCAIASYTMSLAPITWVLISELFPNRIRGAAVSVSVFSLWLACFILTYTFPSLKTMLGMDKTFWLYAAICFLGFVFVLTKVPETKGKTLEQIEKELVD